MTRVGATMSEEKQEWFIAERARVLAMVALTRRDDLLIMPAGQSVGIQFLVCITKEGTLPVRQFGLALRGTLRAVTESHLDQVLRPAMQEFLHIGEFPYPVCLFHFTMDDSQGYYTWVAEPLVGAGGPVLLRHESPQGRKLDKGAVDEIVGKVDRWYDASFAQIAVRTS
jgi:hypothetical protein